MIPITYIKLDSVVNNARLTVNKEFYLPYHIISGVYSSRRKPFLISRFTEMSQISSFSKWREYTL